MNRSIFSLLIVVSLVLSTNKLLSQSHSSNTEEFDYLEFIQDRSLRFDTALFSTNTFAFPEDDLARWKEWTTVENFTFGKDRGGLPMIADLSSLHPYFRDQIIKLINTCHKKGIELAIVETFRTKAKQSEYYSMGREYTLTRGGKSRHQYGLAVDVVPVVNGKPQWDNKYLWKKIGIVGESLGLRWGGRWRSIYDPAHFEWSGGVSTYYLEKGTYPVVPNPKNYPCIEDDLSELKKNWEAWETEQSSLARKN